MEDAAKAGTQAARLHAVWVRGRGHSAGAALRAEEATQSTPRRHRPTVSRGKQRRDVPSVLQPMRRSALRFLGRTCLPVANFFGTAGAWNDKSNTEPPRQVERKRAGMIMLPTCFTPTEISQSPIDSS